jgi:hypothetical protein
VDHKILKLIAREAPLAYKAFFGRKYILPQYRQADYVNQDKQNEIAFDRLCTFASGVAPLRDEPWMTSLGATVASLCFNRPTLFLERELGEALVRTEVLEALTTGDIRWRWPAFRVYLPRGLVKIDRQGEEADPRWAAYYDICEVSDKGDSCPLPIAREIDAFVAKHLDDGQANRGALQKVNFVHKEPGIAVATALNKSDAPNITQTIYAQLRPWGEISLGDYQRVCGELKGGYTQDEADKHFLLKVQHLMLNVLLFLSSTDEYEPLYVLRTASPNPAKPQGELVKARFVGDVRVRAVRVGELPKPRVLQPAGRHHAAHWVSGHWKRVVYGVGRSQRRLQWIQPYQTTDETAALYHRLA